MEALCSIAQGNGLCFPGGAVHIAAAGTDDDGRPVLLLAQGDFTVQDVALQGGIGESRDRHMDHFHNISSCGKGAAIGSPSFCS